MKINEILAENITKDYFNAKVKTEVIFDTILTPVIGEILTVIGRENKKLKINGEMKLLAKEFPMLKLNEENEKTITVTVMRITLCVIIIPYTL